MLTRIGGDAPPTSVVKTLHGTTDGNPFFLCEVVTQLLAQRRLFDDGGWLPASGTLDFEVPDSVRFTIEERLHGLQPRHPKSAHGRVSRRTATSVSTSSRHSATCPRTILIDAVDEAERARLIVSTIDAGTVRFSFAHELVRQTLLNQVTHTRRQRLHAGVADALERVHDDSLSEHAARDRVPPRGSRSLRRWRSHDPIPHHGRRARARDGGVRGRSRTSCGWCCRWSATMPRRVRPCSIARPGRTQPRPSRRGADALGRGARRVRECGRDGVGGAGLPRRSRFRSRGGDGAATSPDSSTAGSGCWASWTAAPAPGSSRSRA